MKYSRQEREILEILDQMESSGASVGKKAPDFDQRGAREASGSPPPWEFWCLGAQLGFGFMLGFVQRAVSLALCDLFGHKYPLVKIRGRTYRRRHCDRCGERFHPVLDGPRKKA